MATATANMLDDPVSVKEENGSIVELVMSARITGISGASGTAKLVDAYQALDSAGYTAFSSTAQYTALRLVNRDISFYQNDNAIATATLTYKTSGLGFDQVGVFIPTIGSSLQQVPTNFDIFGNQITVSHTYTGDSDPKNGQTETVTAEVQQLFPQSTITYNGVAQSDIPLSLQQAYLGYINSAYWNGGAPGTWLCSDISATARDLSRYGGKPYEWDWSFTFQYDLNGWNVDAIFIDGDTGKPPTGLVDGVGVVSVQTQPFADFNTLFPAY